MIDAPTVLAVLVVVVAMPLNWYVTVRLWRMSRAASDVRLLRERAISWLALVLIVTVFGFVFINNGMGEPILDSKATMLLTRGALLVLSIIPALYWLRMTRR